MPLLNVSVYWRKGHFCNHNFRCFIGFVLFTWFDFQVGFSVKCVFFFFLYFLPSLIVFWNFRTWEISRNSYGQKGKLKKQNFVVGDFMHVMWLTKMTHASQEFLGKRQQCFWLLAFDDKEYVPSEFFKTIGVILNKFFHSKNTRRKRSFWSWNTHHSVVLHFRSHCESEYGYGFYEAFIIFDILCGTASIWNMTAISIDRLEKLWWIGSGHRNEVDSWFVIISPSQYSPLTPFPTPLWLIFPDLLFLSLTKLIFGGGFAYVESKIYLA